MAQVVHASPPVLCARCLDDALESAESGQGGGTWYYCEHNSVGAQTDCSGQSVLGWSVMGPLPIEQMERVVLERKFAQTGRGASGSVIIFKRLRTNG